MAKLKISSVPVALITLVLSTVSLVGIGFASWTINGTDQKEKEGVMAADIFSPLIEGVSVSTRSKFTISHYHFENVDSYGNVTYSDTGSLSLDFAIDEDNVNDQFIEGNVLNLTINLSFADGLPLFKTNYINDENISLSLGNISRVYRSEDYTSLYADIRIPVYGMGSIIHTYLTYTFNYDVIAKYGDEIVDNHFMIRVAGIEVVL